MSIMPNMPALSSELKQTLLRQPNQYAQYMLHYLCTGEFTEAEIPATMDAGIKAEILNKLADYRNRPDPEEIEMWEQASALTNPGQAGNALVAYLVAYPSGSHASEAKTLIDSRVIQPVLSSINVAALTQKSELNVAKSRIDDLTSMFGAYINPDTAANINRVRDNISRALQTIEDRERAAAAAAELEAIRYDWESLRNFIRKERPGSTLFNLADDYMWALVDKEDSTDVNRYKRHVPGGNHIAEADQLLGSLNEWNDVKDADSLQETYDYIEAYPDSPFIDEAQDLLARQKKAELEKIQKNPSAYDRLKWMSLRKQGIITDQDIIRIGAGTPESIDKALKREELLKDTSLSNIPFIESNLLDNEDITDIFLFGVPSTGKTCVLMGLLGSGKFTWNSKIAHGEYGNRLTKLRDDKLLPDRTRGDDFYKIHGTVKDKKGLEHIINIFELAGEQFLDKIARNPNAKNLKLDDMGSVAQTEFRNSHRKIFLIVIDPTTDRIKHKIEVDSGQKNADGNPLMTTQEIQVSQATIINGMMDILSDPANKDIMEKVDALHFIATKADVLSITGQDVMDKVKPYGQSFNKAADLCAKDKYSINEATGFKPRLYTFSLGRFYVGGTFDYVSDESDTLMGVIADNTIAIYNPNFLQKFCDATIGIKIF